MNLSTILQILKGLSALIDLLEMWLPEEGEGKNKLELALELIVELWNDGEQLVAERRDLLVKAIGKLVTIKNLWGSWRK